MIWLNHGAITDPYFCGQLNIILPNSDCTTPKVLKMPCRLCPSGASSVGSMQLPRSVSTSMLFMTLMPRGRSGQKKPRIAWFMPHLDEPSVELNARLRICGAAPRQSIVISSPLTVIAHGYFSSTFSRSVESEKKLTR